MHTEQARIPVLFIRLTIKWISMSSSTILEFYLWSLNLSSWSFYWNEKWNPMELVRPCPEHFSCPLQRYETSLWRETGIVFSSLIIFPFSPFIFRRIKLVRNVRMNSGVFMANKVGSPLRNQSDPLFVSQQFSSSAGAFLGASPLFK